MGRKRRGKETNSLVKDGKKIEWTAKIQAVTSHHCGHSSGPLSLCHQATSIIRIISGSK